MNTINSAKVFQYVLGGIIIIGFFILLVILIIKVVPDSNRDLLNLVIGALLSSFATVVNYFYGSSAGSAAKSEASGEIKP